MKKVLIIIIGTILLAGIVISFVQISHSINLDKEEKDTLSLIGINEPLISSCIKLDNYTCKANVFEKNGINKDIEIVIRYCEEYEIICSNGDCLNWIDENQTECLEYEILNQTTSNCIQWKVLNQVEIETEMKKEVEALLKSIADVQASRNRTKEVLTDEIKVEIKEKIKETPKS